MNEKELAEFKNRILSLIVDKEDGADHRWLFYTLNIEGLTEDYLIKILEGMEKDDSDILSIEVGHTHHLRRTFNTQRFLDIGGYVNQYESDKEADEETLKLKLEDNQRRNLQAENLKLTTKLNRQRLKTHWMPIAISILGLAIATASYFRPSNDVSKEQMNTKIESLEDEVKQLQNGLKQENEKLKDELYKAEMMVKVLEEETPLPK